MESGTFSDFLQQLQGQAPIVGIFSLFAVLTLFVFVLIIYLRVRRRSVEQRQQQGTTSTGTMFGGQSQSNANMPDLNMLLATDAPTRTQPNLTAEPDFLRQPGIVNVQMSNGRVVEASEMLIISRDRLSDNLIVQIGEHAYDGSENGVHPEFRKRFVKLMREVSEIAPALSKVDKNAAAPSAAPKPAPAAPPPAVVQPTPPAPQADGGPIDLAAQIEAYLQHKLTTSPQFASRGLHVHSAPDGSVRIEVDGQFYPSVEDVDDAAVRQFLQQTISEWQSTR